MNLEISQKTTEALRWIVEILVRCKIDYQISGGLAGKIFGSQRKLNDIDIDIPDKYLNEILPEISKYVVYGPERYLDGKWDLELITLNYQGQEIDISGADTLLISNKKRTRWIPLQTDFSKCLNLTLNGVDIKVINPRDLIEYKKELNGEHQLEDIRAAQQYLSK